MGAAGSTPISSALLPPPPAAMFSGLLTVSVNMKTHFLKAALSTHHVSCRHPGDVRSGSGFCDGANVHGAVCECLMSKQPNVNPCTGETQGVHSTAIFCFSLTNMWVCVPVDNNWPPSRTSCSVHGAHTHTHSTNTSWRIYTWQCEQVLSKKLCTQRSECRGRCCVCSLIYYLHAERLGLDQPLFSTDHPVPTCGTQGPRLSLSITCSETWVLHREEVPHSVCVCLCVCGRHWSKQGFS